MKNKVNMKDIHLLLPDYIAGSLNADDARNVENAIKSNVEISEMYNKMKSAFEFVESVRSEEPVPQYWNNLLPRIHERLETRLEKKFFGKQVSVIWKVLVPIAAVILIALIYRVVFISENQYTEKNEIIIQKEP
jgi:anti-sigma-K factor RskA